MNLVNAIELYCDLEDLRSKGMNEEELEGYLEMYVDTYLMLFLPISSNN